MRRANGDAQRRIDPPTPRETLSIAALVGLDDIPYLVGERPERGGDFGRLIAAIDGASTAASIAVNAKLDPHLARAWFAELLTAGHVAFERRSSSGPQPERASASGMRPRVNNDWLQGLRPRTGK